jgi:hypothetical protein
VLKIAHGALKSGLKPTCWKPSPLKVARNSSVVPGVKVATGPTRAPSTVRRPPATTAEPPPDHGSTLQFPGSGASNGRSRPAARWTSTSVAVPAFVPAAKSAGSASCRQAATTVAKLAGAAGGAGRVVELVEASAELTR